MKMNDKISFTELHSDLCTLHQISFYAFFAALIIIINHTFHFILLQYECNGQSEAFPLITTENALQILLMKLFVNINPNY